MEYLRKMTRKLKNTRTPTQKFNPPCIWLLSLGVWIALLGCVRHDSIDSAVSLPLKALSSCNLEDRFSKLVFNVLTEQRAMTQSSFSLMLISRKTGAVLCEDSVARSANIYPASTIKTLIAVAILRLVDQGKIQLSTSVAIDQVNADAECSQWGCAQYGKGKKRSISALLEDMITISNNIATNQLIDVASKPFINQTADDLEAPSLRVIRKVYDTVNPEPEITDRSRATAEGLSAVYREIVSGRLGLLGEPSRQLLIETLGRQKINGSLNRNFPSDVKFFHKTGNTSEVIGDGGFYYVDDETAAIVVGLLAFHDFKLCDVCKSMTGFQSLGTIGGQTLDLTRSLDN